MAETPHFALPFRMEGGSVVVNEQNSTEDVASCVEAVLRTRPGDRDELPEFGSRDLTFTQRPLDVDALVSDVEEWEPRARILAEERPDLLDEVVTTVRLTLDQEG